jgi:DNA-binding transcriptional regulator YiaG
MAKRTGNSSVNSSIRQQTKTNDEGFGNLLAAQQASLGELSSIRQLLELSKEHEKLKKNENGGLDSEKIQEKLLDVAEQQLRGSRTYWKTRDEMDQVARQETDKITELAKAMNTSGNFIQKLSESLTQKKEGIKEKYGIANGGLKKTVLGALNVGGVFNKTLSKDAFKAKQRALGNDVTDEDAEGAYNASKELKFHEKKISAIKTKHGISDEEFAASKVGTEMLNKKEQLANVYRSYDKSTKAVTPDPTERNINYEAAPKSATATAAEAMQGAEAQEEGKRAEDEQISLLKQIADNTTPAINGGDAKPNTPETKSGGGLLDSLFSMLSSGLMNAFKALLNPGMILKALGKVFAIGMIVGALFEGIMDGFEEFQKSGDIGKALIAGLAGIVDFLTFGLFDKDKIKEVIGDMATWTNDHIVKPIIDFFGAMKDSFMSVLSSIGIPKITLFTNPITQKDVTVGPFYPFKSDGGDSKPEAATPTSADAVGQKSADNAGAAIAPSKSNNTAVVNAPVTNNSTTTQVIRSPIRNQESSINKYTSNRYA